VLYPGQASALHTLSWDRACCIVEIQETGSKRTAAQFLFKTWEECRRALPGIQRRYPHPDYQVDGACNTGVWLPWEPRPAAPFGPGATLPGR